MSFSATSLPALVRAAVLWRRPASTGEAILRFVIAAGLAAAIAPRLFVVNGDVLNDGHALLSMDLAVARAYCGQPSAYSPSIRIPHAVRDDMTLRTVPVEALLTKKAGSIAAFCATVNTPFVNNENSLMLYETLLFKAAPGVSIGELGEWLHLTRIAIVLVFVFVIGQMGASIGMSVATILCALFAFSRMHDQIYCNNPFFFPLVLLEASLVGAVARHLGGARWSMLIAIAAVAGMLGAFVANMRTSFLPLQGALVAVLILSDWVQQRSFADRRRRLIRALAMMVVFIAGYQLFQYGLITRGLPPQDRYGSSHTIAHPLVLALGVPPTDFARREGLSWLDAVGAQKALSVDPDAAYLGPRYDRALFSYYSSLWRVHTRDMMTLYWTKFSIAGTDMIETLRLLPGRDGQLLRWLLTPLSYFTSGIALLALYALITVASLWFYVRQATPWLLVAGFLSAGATLAHIEVGVIYSQFTDQYHNYLVFYAFLLSIAFVQVLINTVARLLGVPAGPAAAA
jgi:hypothetical protein